MKEVLHPNFLKFWLFCRYFSDSYRILPTATEFYRQLPFASGGRRHRTGSWAAKAQLMKQCNAPESRRHLTRRRPPPG